MPQTPLIRPIRPEEMAEAKQLVFQVAHELMEPEAPFESFKTQWNSYGVLDDLHDVQKNYFDHGGVFLALVAEGRIVGTGAFLRYEAEGYCELKRIALLPGYRGRGNGCALLMELIQRARTMGYTRAILWTNRYKLARAVAFYRQIGFVEVAHPGADDDDIWMEMAIAPRSVI